MENTEPELVTVGEAASALRCTTRTIRNYIACGRLRAVRLGGRWLIARTELDTLRALAGAAPNMRAPIAMAMNIAHADEDYDDGGN